MQSGIAYAAGQLLAVVAPRTVLVVDAPTDWSLAGPLWELALDDAPVDEILDVLVRRGIRTAPSFAIVRVEADAVRTLVRGGVPVCFERAGEPVRLDATGATTWLEGLISGARRVLVGDVETGVELPFHVSTGVVLVSGLALTCAPAENEGELAPAGTQAPGEPVPAGAARGGSALDDSASLSLTGVSGRERRVVDLTEGESRTPAYSGAPGPELHEGWALTPSRSTGERTGGLGRDLNGHVPAVLDPVTPAQPAQLPAPSSFFEPRTGDDDPGELLDVDPASVASPASDLLSRPGGDEQQSRSGDSGSGSRGSGLFGTGRDSLPAGDEPSEPADEQARSEPSEFDDLLTDSAPKGPSPADLPSLTSGGIDLPVPSGHGAGAPSTSRRNGVPAGWPPAPDEPETFSQFRSELAEPPSAAPETAAPESAAPRAGASSWAPPEQDLPAAPEQPSSLGDLPLRVRGRSLRPELGHGNPSQTPGAPMNGSRLLGNPSDQSPAQAGSVFEPQTPVTGEEMPSAELSQEMLPPAFYRGSRSRQDERQSPPSDEDGSAPWQSTPADSQWALPRRGFNGNGFNGNGFDGDGFDGQPSAFSEAAPAMPDAFRPDSGDPQDHAEPADDHDDITRFDQEPIALADEDDEPESVDQDVEAPREPPRLLGVWCDAGHVTSPDRSECRVCGLTVPPQAPILVARPPLGVLVFDNGDRIELDRPVVLGRDPKPQAQSADPEPPILHAVASSTGQVSRTHAEIRPSGWDVLLTDLGAMNGTALTLPGEAPQAIEPGVPTTITPGSRVDLGGETGFVFEVEG